MAVEALNYRTEFPATAVCEIGYAKEVYEELEKLVREYDDDYQLHLIKRYYLASRYEK